MIVIIHKLILDIQCWLWKLMAVKLIIRAIMIFIALNKRLIESSLYTVYVPFENSGGLNKKTHGFVIK